VGRWFIGFATGIFVVGLAVSVAAQQAPSSSASQPSGTSSNRLFGALPDFLTVENAPNVPPLTSRQKFEVTARSTFDWGSCLFFGGIAGISQAENADPAYGRGVAGYGKRFALVFADGTAENFLTTAALPSVLHQDPRYFRLGRGTIRHRAAYALSRLVVTRGDSGAAQVNLSELLGGAAAAALYNTYHPVSDRTLPNTIASWWLQIGYDTGFILVREFWPDVRAKLHRHSRT
jgi:hypothetical protein